MPEQVQYPSQEPRKVRIELETADGGMVVYEGKARDYQIDANLGRSYEAMVLTIEWSELRVAQPIEETYRE